MIDTKPSDTPITDKIIPLGSALNADIPHFVIELAGQCRNFERELKRITEAEMPVEPDRNVDVACGEIDGCAGGRWVSDGAFTAWQEYADTLKAYALRMADEARAADFYREKERAEFERYNAQLLQRAESLEQANAALVAENEGLRKALHEIREIWAGMEGIPVPETACESYLLRIITQMKDAANYATKQKTT